MVALADTLRDRFQGTGDPSRTSPHDAQLGMTNALAPPSQGGPPRPTDLPPAPVIDSAALGRLVSQLGNINLAGVDRIVASASGSATVELPGADALLGRIQPLLSLVGTLRSDSALAVLDQLRAEPASPTLGMAGIEASLGQLLGARRSAAVTALLDGVRRVLPVPVDVDGPIGRIGEAALATRDLVTLIGALMAIHTSAVDLRGSAAMIDQLLAPETADALIRRARVWTDAEAVVAAVQAVSDPEDELQVGGVENSVAEVTRALDDLAGALTRAMGFGEATLIHADPARSAAALDAAATQLRSVDAHRVRASIEALAGLLARVVPVDTRPPALDLGDAWSVAADISGRIVTAIGSLSAAPLTRPIQQGLGAVTSAIQDIHRIFGEISGAIRGAFATVRAAVTAIDVQGVAREIARFLQPLVDAIHELDGLLHNIETAITTAAVALTAAIHAIGDVLTAGAGHVADAFTAIQQVIHDLDIPGLIDRARAGVQGVADELHRVQLQPYFDEAIDVMNTGADVISAVPLNLLPDSAKRELDKVVQPIQAIDFQGQVVDVLEHELHTILDRVDTDVLGAIDAEFHKVIAALGDFDPRKIIDPLDAEFDRLVARIEQVNPEELLRPVIDAVAQIRTEIGRLDLRARILDPIEHAFDGIVAGLDRIDPSVLLQPVEDQVSSIRQRVLDVTHIDQWADRVEDVHRAIDGFLARIDLASLGPRLDAMVDAALAVGPSPGGSDGSVVGALVASLVEGLGIHARPSSFVAVLGWITGDDGAAEVRALVAASAASLAHAHATVRGNDLRAIAAQLDVGFRRLRAAVQAHPAGSKLRTRLDPILAAAAPLDVLGALGDSQDRYLAALEATTSAVRAMTARGLSEVTAASGGIRDAFLPLATARGRVIELGRALGVDLAGRDLRGVLAPLLGALRPSRLLTVVGPVVAALRDKIREILVDGLLAPVQAGIAELTTLVHDLDVSVFRTELAGLFSQLKTELEALRPSVVLGPALTQLEHLRDDLAAYDPLLPVKDVIAALRQAVDQLARAFRPSTLMHGLIATYDELVAIARGLDVKTLLDPILSALRDLEAQLDSGLDGAAGAFAHLQGALASAGTGGASGSISVSAGVSA